MFKHTTQKYLMENITHWPFYIAMAYCIHCNGVGNGYLKEYKNIMKYKNYHYMCNAKNLIENIRNRGNISISIPYPSTETILNPNFYLDSCCSVFSVLFSVQCSIDHWLSFSPFLCLSFFDLTLLANSCKCSTFFNVAY